MGALLGQFLQVLERGDSARSDHREWGCLLDLGQALEIRSLHHPILIDVGVDHRGALVGVAGHFLDQIGSWGFRDIQPAVGCNHTRFGVQAQNQSAGEFAAHGCKPLRVFERSGTDDQAGKPEIKESPNGLLAPNASPELHGPALGNLEDFPDRLLVDDAS